jgi:hypothetical protein
VRDHHPLELPFKITNGPPTIKTMSSSLQMSIDSIEPSNLKQILDAALSDYKKTTGNELLDQPLATEVQRCDTVNDVLTILQDQAKELQQFKDGDHRLMEQIGPLTQVLFAFSGTLGVGDVDLVLLLRGDWKYVLT